VVLQAAGLAWVRTLAFGGPGGKKTYVLRRPRDLPGPTKGLGSDILVEGDGILLNIYHRHRGEPKKWPKVNFAGGKASPISCLQGNAGHYQAFGIEKFGSPLFFPMPARKRRPGA